MAEAELAGLVVAPGEDAVRAWGRLPAGTAEAYVRFPRGALPLAAVQRLARRGRVVVDAAPRDAEDALDLAVAGAAGIVAWLADGGDVRAMADAVGDGLVLGCTAQDAEAAANLGRELGLALLVADAEPPEGVHGFRVDLREQPPVLRRFGEWPAAHEEPPLEPAEGDNETDAEDVPEEER